MKQACYCGSGQSYSDCCGVFISGAAFPDTPEQLMRSRYSAYAQANMHYIADTMRGPAAEGFDIVSSELKAKSVKWLRLKVLATEFDVDTNKGYVEFIAVYREGGGAAQKMHERSEFHRIDGRWYYWDGISV